MSLPEWKNGAIPRMEGDDMGVRDEILLSLQYFAQGEYDLKTFCDVFISLYYGASSGYKLFGGVERAELDKIAQAAVRYSPFPDDIERYPNTYCSERQAGEIIRDAISRLTPRA